MVWIPGGTFEMGAVGTYPEEGPIVPDVPVDGFWISRHEVTNAEFAAFVEATGHVTAAERDGASVVFMPPENLVYGPDLDPAQWWRFVQGADWRHPEGPGSDIAGRANFPVVHIAVGDAEAYAAWAGGALPSEAQFEYAARDAARQSPHGAWTANTWQGTFPVKNTGDDGHTGAAPVGCFTPNSFGLYDMVGNVWEWTSTPYAPSHAMSGVPAAGYDPRQPGVAVRVIKGGSYLCAANYCARYRPEARHAQETGLGAAHIGFRIVKTG